MKKSAQLRKVLEENNLFIKNNPNKLNIFIDNGDITATAAKCLTFEYEYTLNLMITGYDQSINDLMVPILSWMYLHQQGFMANPVLRKDAVKFEVKHLGNSACDININLKLTEQVIVKKGEKEFEYTYVNDKLPVEMRSDWINEIEPMI